MAIKGDRFIYVGSDAGAAEYIGDGTAVVDLQGKTVTPGLIDSHMHPLYLVENVLKPPIVLRDLGLKEIQNIIAAEAAKAGPGKWIQGVRYSVMAMAPAEPHKDLLRSCKP